MRVVKVSLQQAIHWPAHCAFCMATAEHQAVGRRAIISSASSFHFTRKTLNFQYPVCSQHRRFARFLSWFMRQSAVDLFIGLLFLPLIIIVPLAFIPGMNDSIFVPVLVVTYVWLAMSIIALKMKQPVSFSREKKGHSKVRLRNDQFAAEFVRLNPEGQ